MAGEVAFYCDRSGTGMPVVLVHSINAAASAMEMKPLFERFRGVRPVYAIELPGFGFSPRTDRSYSPELYAHAIAHFVEEVIGQGPVDLIALSLSCEFAALAVLAAPAVFASLTMISPTGFGNAGIPYSEFRRKSLSVPIWSQAFFDVLTSNASIRHYLAKSFSSKAAVPAELAEYAFATSHQPGARFAPLYFLGGHLFTPDVRQRFYAELKLPVQVLYDRDGYSTFEALPGFVKEHPNWTAVRVPGTFGMPHWERPDETFAALQ